MNAITDLDDRSFEQPTDPFFIGSVTGLEWFDPEHTAVRSMVTFPNHPWGYCTPLEYVSVANDIVPHAVQLYADLIAGKYGPIADYGSDGVTANAAQRTARDTLLTSTDWTQLPDVPAATRAKWADYRQALRDVPSQPGFPATITWPVAPQ